MKNKLALFDLDGTLFNTNDVNYYSYLEAVAQEGYTIDYNFWCEQCNGRHYKYFLPLLGIEDEKMMERIHKRKKELYPQFLKHAKVNDHLFSIIEGFEGKYYMAVVTTASRKNAEEILGYYDKIDRFELILTQEDISQPKPDPEGFLLAMNHFGMSAANTIIFEDSDVGIEAARKTGAAIMRVEAF